MVEPKLRIVGGKAGRAESRAAQVDVSAGREVIVLHRCAANKHSHRYQPAIVCPACCYSEARRQRYSEARRQRYSEARRQRYSDKVSGKYWPATNARVTLTAARRVTHLE